MGVLVESWLRRTTEACQAAMSDGLDCRRGYEAYRADGHACPVSVWCELWITLAMGGQ